MTDAPQQPGTSPVETTSTPAPVGSTPAAPTASPPSATTEAAPSLVNTAPAPTPEPLTADAITIPEGLTLDNDSMSTFLGVMNDAAMSPQERAQALIDLQASLTTKSSEAGSQAWQDQQAAWQAEIAADPVIGGANLESTIAGIGNLLNRFGNPEVRAAFDQTGAGNNPHIVRFLSTLVAQVKEPGPTDPGRPPGPGGKTLEERLYPNPT